MSTETTPSSGSSATPLDLEPIEVRDSEWPHKANIEEMALDRRALLREVKRLRSLLGEEEWEYGWRSRGAIGVSKSTKAGAEYVVGAWKDKEMMRRRPAGPWQPVPPSTTDTTKED